MTAWSNLTRNLKLCGQILRLLKLEEPQAAEAQGSLEACVVRAQNPPSVTVPFAAATVESFLVAKARLA